MNDNLVQNYYTKRTADRKSYKPWYPKRYNLRKLN